MGIILFIAGTALIWWNEGRAVKTTKMLKEAQSQVVELTDLSQVDPSFEGKLVHGLLHPELGHMLLRQEPKDPAPAGFCPYHKGCLEGLASGPAMEKRWGTKAQYLPPDHEAWDLEAAYLAQMCMNAVCVFSPEKIILGGGVMQQKHLFPLIRQKTKALLNGYIHVGETTEHIDDYIVEPGLGTKSGATGALLLAREAYSSFS